MKTESPKLTLVVTVDPKGLPPEVAARVVTRHLAGSFVTEDGYTVGIERVTPLRGQP